MSFTIPSGSHIVGDPGHVTDHNGLAAALTALGAGLNIQNAAFAGGADPTGVADSTSAIQAAITAAAAQATSSPSPVQGAPPVYVPPGNYLISSPLSFTAPVRLYGAGAGSRIYSSASGIIDFGNNSINHCEIDHLTLDATGGHVLTNFNLHRSSFHHLVLIERSGNFCIGTLGASGTGLSTTDFDTILQYVFPDASTGVRSVPAWSLLDGTGSGKNLDVLTFRKVTTINQANAGGSFDNTQFIFDIACTVAGSGGLVDRLSFINCDFGTCIGGAIRARSVQGLLIEQAGTGNIYNQGTPTHGVGNSMIYVGQYPAAAAAQSPVITGYTRENSGTITFGSFSDIEVDAATTNATIINPDGTGALTNPAIKINLNGSLGAQVINPPSNVAISNTGTDTMVSGNGSITIGGTALAKVPAAAANFSPGAPAGTVSLTRVMMGLGSTCKYTPATTGKVLVLITANPYVLTAAVFGLISALFGTGTAPVNGAAETGTVIGNNPADTRPPSNGSTVPATYVTSAILALTPGTQYWFDLSLATSNAADQFNLENVAMSFAELP